MADLSGCLSSAGGGPAAGNVRPEALQPSAGPGRLRAALHARRRAEALAEIWLLAEIVLMSSTPLPRQASTRKTANEFDGAESIEESTLRAVRALYSQEGSGKLRQPDPRPLQFAIRADRRRQPQKIRNRLMRCRWCRILYDKLFEPVAQPRLGAIAT